MPMKRTAFAARRKAVGLSQEGLAERLRVDRSTVVRWENGESSPQPGMRPRLARAFHVSVDQLDDLLTPGGPVEPEAMQPFAGQARSLKISAQASPVVSSTEFGDADYLQSVHSHIREIVALDNRFGGAELVRLSTRFFRSLHGQLAAGAYNPKLERDLYAAAGELAEVAGWLAIDAAEDDLARRMNHESLYFTRLSGDKTTELLTIQNMSMHAVDKGHSKEALRLADSVLEGDYRLSPRLRALFLTRKARALAQCGDESALELLPQIRSLVMDGVSSSDPAWAWWIDEGELLGHEARALRDLALPQAITRFEEYVLAAQARPSRTRTRTQYRIRVVLLMTQVERKSWDAAEKTIVELVSLASQVASPRTNLLARGVIDRIESADGQVPSGLLENASKLSADTVRQP